MNNSETWCELPKRDLSCWIISKTAGHSEADLEIVVYPGILVPRIFLGLLNIFKEFSVSGPLFNILLSRFKFLQIFFDISADVTVYSADLPIFSADLFIISAKFS